VQAQSASVSIFVTCLTVRRLSSILYHCAVGNRCCSDNPLAVHHVVCIDGNDSAHSNVTFRRSLWPYVRSSQVRGSFMYFHRWMNGWTLFDYRLCQLNITQGLKVIACVF